MRLLNLLWIATWIASVPALADTAFYLERTITGSEKKSGHLSEPMGIAVNSKDILFVADSRSGTLVKFDSQGKWQGRIGTQGEGPGHLIKPVALALDANGNIYTSDYAQDKIVVFNRKENFLREWGRTGEGKGQFKSPAGIAVSKAGEIFVADFYNARIQVFNTKGKWLRQIGKKGRGDGELYYPTDVMIDSQEKLLVADTYNHRLARFELDGTFISNVGFRWKRFLGTKSALHVPSGLAVDTAGNIYVADSAGHRVVMLNSQGDFLGDWKMKNAKKGDVYSPTKIALGPNGKIYASDTAANQVLVLAKGVRKDAVLGQAPERQSTHAGITVMVDGMTCPFCALGLEKHLSKIKGVRAAVVNLGQGSADLELENKAQVDDNSIRQAVEKAGFQASEIKRIVRTAGDEQ